MAKTGVLHAMAWPIIDEPRGRLPSYGEGFIIGHAITITTTPNYGESPLYGDNEEIDNDTDLIDGGISVNVDEFGTNNEEAYEIKTKLLGGALEKPTESEGGVTVRHTGSAIPRTYFAYGHIEPGKYAKGGKAYFEATFYYRCKFKPTGSTSNTKTNTTTWNTPTIEGKFYRVAGVDEDHNVTREARFDTELAAIEWLESQAAAITAENEAAASSATSVSENEQSGNDI